MSTPRIDSTRNHIDQLIVLLGEFRDEAHDIHDLATNRTRAADEQKVNGGSSDYALDNHGDMRARALYTEAVRLVTKALDPVEISVRAIRSHITKGAATSTYDPSLAAPKAEVAGILNRARRNLGASSVFDRPHPHPITKQPPVAYIEPTVELGNLRAALRKMCKGVKPDRSRLTPAEQDAWRRAVTPEAKAG